MNRLSLLVVALTSALVSPACAQTVVNSCGQQVSGNAMLVADLDCTGFPGHAVEIQHGSLVFNGFTITGSAGSVLCNGPCKLLGPGTVTGSTGIAVNALKTLKITQVDVTNSEIFGIQCFKTCSVEGPATISGNGVGVKGASKVKVRSVTVSGNVNIGVEARNGVGNASASVRESTISGNPFGVVADHLVKVQDSAVTGNTQFGIAVGKSECTRAGIGSLKDSTATGNGTDPGCGTTVACGDIATCAVPPRVGTGSTCDRSYIMGSGIPGSDWDVCALD